MSLMSQPIDPITLEVVRGRLDSICAEMQLTLLKSSHSSIVTEALDATSALYDAQGRTISQAVAIPIHLGVLTELGRLFAQTYPAAHAKPGDLYMINDPYAGGTHLPDIAIAAPVFVGDTLFAYAVTMTHHQDVGGARPGSTSTSVHDHFAEGLRIPLIRLAEGGRISGDILNLVTANTRTPENMRGDLQAQIAACNIGVERLGALFGELGADTIVACMAELLDYAERLTRREIESIPDGSYSFTDFLDDDGTGPDAAAVPICVRIDVKGSGIHFDFAGTAPQVRTAINNVPSSTRSAVYFMVRTLTGDLAPNNDGCYRSVTVDIPEGSILNPRFPAPVNARGASLRRVIDALQGAMAKALPNRIPAAHCGQSSIITMATTNRATGKSIVTSIGGPWMGGMGARPGKDGIDVTDHDASNAYHFPIEVSEAQLPILFRRLELWEDSGGAGTWRGGLGYYEEVEWLDGEAAVAMRRDRHLHGPWGLQGGHEGPRCRTMLARAGKDPEPLPSKCALTMHEGDRLLLWTTGSGGFGEPSRRAPHLVLDDVLDGRVSIGAAHDIYKVAIHDGRIDEGETAKLRRQVA